MKRKNKHEEKKVQKKSGTCKKHILGAKCVKIVAIIVIIAIVISGVAIGTKTF